MEWIEQIADSFVWFVPMVAATGLWFVRCSQSPIWRSWAERSFFAVLLLVAGGTLRTIVVDDPGWLLHTFSLGAMVIGALVPPPSNQIETLKY